MCRVAIFYTCNVLRRRHSGGDIRSHLDLDHHFPRLHYRGWQRYCYGIRHGAKLPAKPITWNGFQLNLKCTRVGRFAHNTSIPFSIYNVGKEKKLGSFWAYLIFTDISSLSKPSDHRLVYQIGRVHVDFTGGSCCQNTVSQKM